MTSLSNLAERLNECLPPSAWLTVTQNMINDFAQLTGDNQWIHIDVERCHKESPYGAPVAHGLFVLSLIPKIIADGPKWADYTTGINYGCDKVRFPAPVRAGARIRAQQTLKSIEPYKGGGVKAAIAVVIEVEGEAAPACYTELIVILYP